MPDGQSDAVGWVHPGFDRLELTDRAGTNLVADETSREGEEGDPTFQFEGVCVVYSVSLLRSLGLRRPGCLNTSTYPK